MMTPLSAERRRSSLRRRAPRLEPRPRILILVEGTTEAEYFDLTRREERLRLVEVVLDTRGGVPKTLVERAAEQKKQARRDARRMRDDNVAYDEVWCVFDVDEHPKLEDAKVQARDNDINIALSNPCFELWLLLHFHDQTAHVHRHQVQKRCASECVEGYAKHVTPEVFRLLTERYADAVRRALALEAWHASRGTQGNNPSTYVYKLTERLRTIRATERRTRGEGR